MFHGDGYVNGGREFVCYVGFDTPTKDENTKWYACACCPPNVTRLIGSIGKYAYGEKATRCIATCLRQARLISAMECRLNAQRIIPMECR